MLALYYLPEYKSVSRSDELLTHFFSTWPISLPDAFRYGESSRLTLLALLPATGNLVIEKPPPPAQPPNLSVGGGPPISPGQGPSGKHQGQINLAQLRLQHMQQAAYAQQKQHQHQHQQHIQQQMRIASQMSQQHARQGVPGMVQQQVLQGGALRVGAGHWQKHLFYYRHVVSFSLSPHPNSKEIPILLILIILIPLDEIKQ